MARRSCSRSSDITRCCMVSAADSLLKYLNYCLHEELLSLEELTSVGQALSEGDVMSDASLLLEETYQLSDYFIQSSERLTSADRLTDLLGKVSYTFAEKVAQSKTPSRNNVEQYFPDSEFICHHIRIFSSWQYP